jgi:DNA invertase Pin-like site-specific DNA recombinase
MAHQHVVVQPEKSASMLAALYLRVSTLNGQSTDNQRLELERVAERHGWQIVEVFEDPGISGARGREQRPAFDRMLKAAVRRDFDVILAWSVDRLGRSLQDLVAFLSEIHAKGVELYVHQQIIDTTTPSGRAMFQMMGVFAEFERAMMRERVLAGLKRARAKGKRLGRPMISPAKERAIRADLAAGLGFRRIMARHGVGTSVIQRIRAELAAEAEDAVSEEEQTD